LRGEIQGVSVRVRVRVWGRVRFRVRVREVKKGFHRESDVRVRARPVLALTLYKRPLGPCFAGRRRKPLG